MDKVFIDRANFRNFIESPQHKKLSNAKLLSKMRVSTGGTGFRNQAQFKFEPKEKYAIKDLHCRMGEIDH